MKTLTLRIPGRPMNSNDRLNRHNHADAVKTTREYAAWAAWETWGPPTKARTGLTYPVTITVTDETRTTNLRDTSNCQPAYKATVDGLQDYGLFPDDGPNHVAAVTFLPSRKTGQDAITLTITGTTE
jgi:hypothetical protein